jgi:alpha-N-arabinofuranosidase
MSAQPKTVNCVAGLAAFQNETHYYAINVKIDAGRLTEVSLEQPQARQPTNLATQALPENATSIELKIQGNGPTTRMFYKIGNGEFTQLGEELESAFLSTDRAGGFQGVTLGMFAHNQQSSQ